MSCLSLSLSLSLSLGRGSGAEENTQLLAETQRTYDGEVD